MDASSQKSIVRELGLEDSAHPTANCLFARKETAPFSLRFVMLHLAAQGIRQADDALVHFGARRELHERYTRVPRAHHGLGVVRNLPECGLANGLLRLAQADG